jgi:hypothetical protein
MLFVRVSVLLIKLVTFLLRSLRSLAKMCKSSFIGHWDFCGGKAPYFLFASFKSFKIYFLDFLKLAKILNFK